VLSLADYLIERDGRRVGAVASPHERKRDARDSGHENIWWVGAIDWVCATSTVRTRARHTYSAYLVRGETARRSSTHQEGVRPELHARVSSVMDPAE
jgi:flavorubredoxin